MDVVFVKTVQFFKRGNEFIRDKAFCFWIRDLFIFGIGLENFQ